MKINEIISEIDRRGFLKGMGAAAVAGAGIGSANAQDINLVQKQYNWQFANTNGKDTVVEIVKRKAGGKVAVTARNQYFILYNYEEIKSTLPKGFNSGPYGLVLMAVPKEILSSDEHADRYDRQSKSQEQELARFRAQFDRPSKTPRSSGPSASYAGRLKGRIRPNLAFPGYLAGNPRVEVEVRAAPDGTIQGRRIVQSSGNNTWDDAVLRAIDKTEILPKDYDGRVPPSIVLGFRPLD